MEAPRWSKHAEGSMLRLRPRAREILLAVAEDERKAGRLGSFSVIVEQFCEWGVREYRRKGLIPLALKGARAGTSPNPKRRRR
jgi:hypothetical protein